MGKSICSSMKALSDSNQSARIRGAVAADGARASAATEVVARYASGIFELIRDEALVEVSFVRMVPTTTYEEVAAVQMDPARSLTCAADLYAGGRVGDTTLIRSATAQEAAHSLRVVVWERRSKLCGAVVLALSTCGSIVHVQRRHVDKEWEHFEMDCPGAKPFDTLFAPPSSEEKRLAREASQVACPRHAARDDPRRRLLLRALSSVLGSHMQLAALADPAAPDLCKLGPNALEFGCVRALKKPNGCLQLQARVHPMHGRCWCKGLISRKRSAPGAVDTALEECAIVVVASMCGAEFKTNLNVSPGQPYCLACIQVCQPYDADGKRCLLDTKVDVRCVHYDPLVRSLDEAVGDPRCAASERCIAPTAFEARQLRAIWHALDSWDSDEGESARLARLVASRDAQCASTPDADTLSSIVSLIRSGDLAVRVGTPSKHLVRNTPKCNSPRCKGADYAMYRRAQIVRDHASLERRNKAGKWAPFAAPKDAALRAARLMYRT